MLPSGQIRRDFVVGYLPGVIASTALNFFVAIDVTPKLAPPTLGAAHGRMIETDAAQGRAANLEHPRATRLEIALAGAVAGEDQRDLLTFIREIRNRVRRTNDVTVLFSHRGSFP